MATVFPTSLELALAFAFDLVSYVSTTKTSDHILSVSLSDLRGTLGVSSPSQCHNDIYRATFLVPGHHTASTFLVVFQRKNTLETKP